MSNTISAFGAQDFMHSGGSPRTEELEAFWIASSDTTPIFNGDLVQGVAYVSTALGTTGYGGYITQGCSGSDNWIGVFRGCKYYSAAQNRMVDSKYWPGSGATGDVKAYVVTDTNMRFAIQVSSMAILGSSAVGTVFAVAVGGALGGSASAGGNTTTGFSGMSLASSVAGVAPSSVAVQAYPFRLIDFLSNYGPGTNATQPSAGSSLAFVNGMDNTSVGQIVIVQPYDWVGKAY